MDLQELKQVIPNPIQIIKSLDDYIIGQEHAKKTLALMLMNRAITKLQYYNQIRLDAKLEKSNVLLIGPTGTGKTSMIRALSEVADLPISIFDITPLTTAGYIGANVEDILIQHVKETKAYCKSCYGHLQNEDEELNMTYYDYLMDTIKSGIIYLDEIDKVRIAVGSSDSNSSVHYGAVQNELLKLLENGTISFGQDPRYWPMDTLNCLDTTNLFFICGGAFSGLSDIIEKRMNKSQGGIGFNSNIEYKTAEYSKDLLKYVTTQDLIDYGFKPEFLGRLPLRSVLSSLDEKAMLQIIVKNKDSILAQYKAVFNLFEIEFKVEKEALKAIAKKATELSLGARAIKNIFALLLDEYLVDIFDCPDKKIVITKSAVEGRKFDEI